ncbi:hypothetical protein BpHYR1_029650 [Brachionus plicatilis]|uniref:Uncharacterized protein n=1 Tax=Brachionus plicatilis TaxID=10195 RepID=A0A3M7PUS0_BRAPC|nr:hypothetical protein BpHYR1_029650 [Brachionus plicatilis]
MAELIGDLIVLVLKCNRLILFRISWQDILIIEFNNLICKKNWNLARNNFTISIKYMIYLRKNKL